MFRKKFLYFYIFIFLIFGLFLSGLVYSTWSEDGILTVDSPSINEYVGTGVDLSGSYAVLGTYPSFGSSKVAYFFETDGSTWSQVDSVTTSTATDYFGENVGISGDYALVSDYNDLENGGQSGAVFVYKRNGSNWDEIQKFGASDPHNTDFFGDELSMVDNYAVIGAYRNDYDPAGQNLLSEAGAAYIFSRTGDVWTEEQKITPTSSDRGAADWFGRALDVTEDGNYVVVSAYNDDDTVAGSGSLFIFHRENGTWIQTDKLHASTPANNEYFGRSVSIADSGDYIIVGADGNDDNGSNAGVAYIFSRSGSAWAQQAMVTSTDIAAGDGFGYSVSMSADGSYATVSTPNNDSYNGAVYVFSRSGSTWTQTEKLTSSPSTATSFGWDIQLDKTNDKLIVGAPDYTTSTFSSAGGAYILSMASVPIAPTFGSVTVASSSISFFWDTVADASYYTVSSTAASSETTSDTSYVWTSGISPNTEYTFQVSATNASDQEGEYSSATTTYTNPAKPLSLSAVANGQTSANLSWSANNNPTNTVYKIYSGSTLYGSTTSTSYTVIGLTAGTSYTFTVRAIYNSDNTSYVESDSSGSITTAAIANFVILTLSNDNATPSYQFLSKLGEVHTAVVDDIIDDGGTLKAQLTIHSNPVTVTLAAGESQNIDTNGNGSNDMTVTMNSVSSGSTNFTLTFLSAGSSKIYDNPPKEIEGIKAITINNSAQTTDKQKVNLNFNVENAELMAIANNAEFEDVSFEKYNSTKDWKLTEGNGLKTVYAKFRSAQGGTIIYSAQIILTGQNTDAKDEVVIETINDNTNCPLIKEQAYKTTTNKTVYYITSNCTKRAFQRSDIYFTYFTSWKDVNLTDSKTLNLVANDNLGFMPWGSKYDPKYGALVKTVTDPKVYLLLNNNKYWITNENVFNTLNYHWNWIEDIDQRLLDKYTTKTEITDTTTHPNYTLIKYENDPKVYRLEPDPTDQNKQVKKHIPDETTFNKLNFRFDRVVTVSDTETYTTGVELES